MPFCKLHFTKIRFFVFFLFMIRYYSQKYIIFASNLKTAQSYKKIII